MKNNRFTVIELLVCIAIIVLLCAMIAPVVDKWRNHKKTDTVRTQMEQNQTNLKVNSVTLLFEIDGYRVYSFFNSVAGKSETCVIPVTKVEQKPVLEKSEGK
jgi:Tfp pilus assembly major pilin PilA